MGGFVDDVVKVSTLGLVDTDFAGEGAQEAAINAANIQAQAGTEGIAAAEAAAGRAQEFLSPFAGVGQRGIEESSFLANPQAQFDFLQNNPLFQLALENANRGTSQTAAAGGRSSFGTTQQDFFNNALLSAQPLIAQQRQDIGNLLNLGTGVAGSQANIETGLGATTTGLLTDIGATQAGGVVGASNAEQQAFQNLLNLGTTAGAAAFSDERLKTNKKLIGERNGHMWWSWDWNELAGAMLGLFGSSEGVMAQLVIKYNPNAVTTDDSGFYKVNYGAL